MQLKKKQQHFGQCKPNGSFGQLSLARDQPTHNSSGKSMEYIHYLRNATMSALPPLHPNLFPCIMPILDPASFEADL